MANETINIEVSESGSRTVRRALGDIGAAAESSASSVDLLKKALFGLSVGALVRQIILLSDAYTTLQNKLSAAGVATAAMSTVNDELFKVANDTRATIEGTASVYARLALSTKELGSSYQDLLNFTKSLNQALILSGATGHEAAAGMLQLSQAIASNRLGGDELRSILEQLPVVADVIAKQLKVTRGELRALGSQGKITAKDIMLAFQNARAELEERFAKTVPTVNQAMTVLHNNFVQFVGQLNAATGATSILTSAIKLLGDNLPTVIGGIAILTAAIGVFAGANILGRATAGVLALNAALLANPYLAVLAVIAAAATAIAIFGDNVLIGVDKVTSIKDVFRAIGVQVKQELEDIGTKATQTWDLISTSGNTALQLLTSTTGTQFGSLTSMVSGFYSDLEFNIAGVAQGVLRTNDLVVGSVRGANNALFKIGFDIGTSLVQVWKITADAVGSAWTSVTDNMEKGATAILLVFITWGKKITEMLGGWLPDGIKGFFTDVYKWVVDLFEKLLGWIKIAVNNMREFFGLAAKDMATGIADSWAAKGGDRAAMVADLERYGNEVADAFKKGLIKSGNPTEDWLKKSIEDAKNISVTRKINEMLARTDPADLTGRGKDTTKPPPGKDNSKTIESLQKQILDLEKRVNPARESIAEYEKSLILLNKALKLGAIDQSRYNDVLEQTRQHMRDTVDDTFKAQREFEGMLTIMERVAKDQPGFDKSAQARQVSKKFPDLFFGTDQEIKNKQFAFEQVMAQINMLQQKQIITETQANQMRLVQAGLLKTAIMDAAMQAAQVRLNSGAGTWADLWLTALGKVQQGFTTFTAGTASILGDFYTNLTDGVANSIGRAIVYAEDLGTALRNVAQGALQSLISGFVKLGIQWLINQALGQSIAAAGQAAAIATGTATAVALAAAWAPAAAAVSLASYGANSAAAIAGMSAAYTAASAMSLLGGLGFKKGGFTGNSPKDQVAGVVHGREYVMSASATRRIGVPALDAMQSGRMTGAATRAPSGSNRGGGITVHYQNFGSNKDVQFEQLGPDEIRIIARDVAKQEGKKAVYTHAASAVAIDMANPNGTTSKALARNTLVTRRRSS